MSDLTLIIGNKNYSSWSLRPWIFLKQNQIDFKEIRVPLFTDTTHEALSPYHSNFKVPILQDGDLEVWDSLAILEYVSEMYMAGGGWPSDAGQRALARSVSAEMHSSFVNVRSELPMNCRKTFTDIILFASAEREVERIKSLWRTCRTAYGAGGEWLFGDYSIADAMFAPIVLRFSGYSIPLDGVEKAYVESVLSQPCIKEWIAAGRLETEVIAEDEIDA